MKKTIDALNSQFVDDMSRLRPIEYTVSGGLASGATGSIWGPI